MLDAWRAEHHGHPLPVRLQFIDALAQRADAASGAVRALLDERLTALIEAHARDLKQASAQRQPPQDPTPSALGALLTHIARHHGDAPAEAASPHSPASAFPEMPALDEFRHLWSQVRSESQMRQSLQEAPENAGPLNSNALVHRAVALMRDTSPDYLQHFLAYVDALSWMAALTGAKDPKPANDIVGPGSPRKRAKPKPRKRKT
nr:DUF2894 domain-containing protein [Oleiagrimonas sp. C23AA]